MFILSFFFLGSLTPAMAAESDLYKLQALFIQKMVHYIEWFPKEQAHFMIGIHNNPLLLEGLKSFNDQVIMGKNVKVVAIDNLKDLSTFSVIYTHGVETIPRVPQSLLVITDRPDTMPDYSMINFVFIDGKLRFDINQTEAKKAQLKLNSRLLKLARELK